MLPQLVNKLNLVFGVASKILVIVISVLVARHINYLGNDAYSAFIFMTAILNFSAMLELGFGGALQNHLSRNRYTIVVGKQILKIQLTRWVKYFLPVLGVLIVFGYLILNFLPPRESLGELKDLQFKLYLIGLFGGSVLAVTLIISKALFGLGQNNSANLFAVIPYIYGGVALLLYSYISISNITSVFAYFFGLTVVSILTLVLYLIRIQKTETSEKLLIYNLKDEKNSFFIFSLLGVIILNSDILIGGWFLESSELAEYGIMQRVYFTFFILTSTFNSLIWKNLAYNGYGSQISRMTVRRLCYGNLIIIMPFFIVLYYFSDIWLNFFYVDNKVSNVTHLLFLALIAIRSSADVMSVYFQSCGKVKLLNWIVSIQLLLTITLMIVFKDNLGVHEMIYIQITSFSFVLFSTAFIIKWIK